MHRKNGNTLAMMLLIAMFSSMSWGEIRTGPVEYRDGPVILKGYLAYDDATEDMRPAVLIVPEWWGLTDYPKHRAVQLARMGYVAFVADIFGDGKTTDDAKQ